MSRRKVEILYFIDHIDGPGGTERHLSYLVTLLDKARFKCSIVVFDLVPNVLVDALVAQGVEIHHIPVARYYVPNALRKALVIRRYIKNNKIDIVQTYHYKSDIYACLIAWFSGVKYLISSKRDVADFKGGFNFFLHRLVRPLVDRYIVVSDVVADVIVSKERADRRKIVKIYNGVNLDGYQVPTVAAKLAAKAALGLTGADFVIGMVAWMRPEKDHMLLLTAFRKIREQINNAKLVLIGDGPHSEEYKEWVAAKGLNDDVKFLGMVNDVKPFVAAFDVACLVPKGNEGFSNSILEKMAMGLPVVVTDVGGNREAVEHGVNGFVIEPGALQSLVDCLQLLARDRQRLEQMGIASRQRVERLFSLQQMIRRHEELYTALVTGEAAIA